MDASSLSTTAYGTVGRAIETVAGPETDLRRRSAAMAVVLVILYLASRGLEEASSTADDWT